ncbi:MAG: hypothetical protein ACJ77C_00695 [Chloroflexota bacterium]
MGNQGEPISRGRRDSRAADQRSLNGGVFFVAFFGVVVLVNGILAILGIEVMQSLGVWPTPEASPDAP